jgi:hypothetical protein
MRKMHRKLQLKEPRRIDIIKIDGKSVPVCAPISRVRFAAMGGDKLACRGLGVRRVVVSLAYQGDHQLGATTRARLDTT